MIPKFTWITIFLSVFITVSVTEVVIHEYSLNHPAVSQVEGIAIEENASQHQASPEISQDDLVVEPVEEVEEEVSVVDQEASPINIEKSNIDETILISAKVKNPLLKRRPFNGKIFSLIETGYDQQQVLEEDCFDGEQFLGTIYEIQFKNPIDTELAYAKLKNEALLLEGVTINETSAFGGDKSFYVNNQNKKNTVFIITQIANNIYGFQYPHASHQIFKSIVQYL